MGIPKSCVLEPVKTEVVRDHPAENQAALDALGPMLLAAAPPQGLMVRISCRGAWGDRQLCPLPQARAPGPANVVPCDGPRVLATPARLSPPGTGRAAGSCWAAGSSPRPPGGARGTSCPPVPPDSARVLGRGTWVTPSPPQVAFSHLLRSQGLAVALSRPWPALGPSGSRSFSVTRICWMDRAGAQVAVQSGWPSRGVGLGRSHRVLPELRGGHLSS